ncbi:MAG: hypothetical protein TE42_09810 [Candidatus Synechococcus spongiarum SP3]|uniref:Uncharacterized protein n=1 Tax=Candidatus Synechococcus spongiarum SP3 TaxID=1604020 RepID=A0A0G2J424_9SYNE|nr:MAG: hypothetical protein TE42_09810 [Candidatus Synechococcus spongiarum SP3]
MGITRQQEIAPPGPATAGDGRDVCQQCNIKHKSQTHRCRERTTKPMFIMRLEIALQGAHLKYREWAVGAYIYTNDIMLL